MSYGSYLIELLRPLGVYDLSAGKFSTGELESVGQALDGCFGDLEQLQQEMVVLTAQGQGLSCVEKLLGVRPAAPDTEHRREALAALLRIGGDSFTLAAINDNLSGCGLNAVVSETDEQGVVEVRFPEVAGIPDGFEQMAEIIEQIIPCHLEIDYVFWYITWEQLEAKFHTWEELDQAQLTWEELERLVV